MHGISDFFTSSVECTMQGKNLIPKLLGVPNLSISSFFILFTLMYLICPMAQYKDWNYYIILGFLCLYMSDVYIKLKMFCITPKGIFVGSIFGLVYGWICYMIMKSAGLDQTQRQNALSKKWAITDVLESFCKRGFSNYIVVKSFMEDFGFTLYQSLTILTLNQLSTEQTINFKSGNFEIKDLNRSKIAAKNLLKLKDVVALNDTIIFRAFFHLVTKCEEFDVNYFIQKMQYQSQKFKKQRDRALQIENIEEIYNYRNQNKVNLRIIK